VFLLVHALAARNARPATEAEIEREVARLT
jgi:hypothetical protein